MKIILTESQYNLLESYLFEDETSNFYGLNIMLNNLKVGDKIGISGNDPIELGKTIELSVDNEDKIFKIVNIDGTVLSLQNTKSQLSPKFEFKGFDTGVVQVVQKEGKGKTIDVTSIKRIVGDKVVAIYRPKSHDPEQQAKDDEEQISKERDAFIKKLTSYQRGDNFIFTGTKNIELQMLGSNDERVLLKPISKEINSGKIIINFESIKYDKANNEITLTFYDDENKSKEISGIKGINDVKGAPKSKEGEKGEEEKKAKEEEPEEVSEKLEELRTLLSGMDKVGQIVNIGEYQFVVVKTYNQSNGVGLRPKDDKSRAYLANILKKLNEDTDSEVFFIKPNNMKEKGDKIDITASIFRNGKFQDFKLGSFDIDLGNFAGQNPGTSKGSTEKTDWGVGLTGRDKKDMIKYIKKNPTLRRAIKKGRLPVKDVMSKLLQKDDEDKDWIHRFRTNDKLRMVNDRKINLEARGQRLNMPSEKEFKGTVKSKDKDKNTVKISGDYRGVKYVMILRRKVKEDIYSGTIKIEGTDKGTDIKIMIKE
jgi:hypothetical protein